MDKIISLLKGRKTYFIGALMILLGVLTEDNQLILNGLGFITLRAGVKKISVK